MESEFRQKERSKLMHGILFPFQFLSKGRISGFFLENYEESEPGRSRVGAEQT